MAKNKDRPALNKPARAALQGHLDRLLSEVTVSGHWPDWDSYPEIRRFHQALIAYETWRSHITTFDLFELIAGVMERLDVNLEGAARKLPDVLTKEQFARISVALRDHLLSIPLRYKLWVELPSMPNWGVGSIKLSQRLELAEIESKERTGTEMIADAMVGRGLRDFRVKLAATSVYLVIDAHGYGGARLDTTAVADGISQLKQFFQMFRRTDVFERQWAAGMLEQHIECWIVDPQYPKQRMNITLPPALSKFVASVAVDEEKLKVPDEKSAQKTILTALWPSKRAETRDECASALLGKISWVSRLMNAPPSEDAARIRSAFEWAFDSEQNDNQTLSFLQACIGLEALLGDSAVDEPLVARLKDRCAYLLGKSHEDRDAIRKRFAVMYDVRSKVIHGRTPRLSPSDAQHLEYAQTVLNDVISEEADRLLKMLKD